MLSCIARILSVTVIISIFIFIAFRHYGVAISIPIFDRNLLNVSNTDLLLLLRSSFSKVPQTYSTTNFPQKHESIKRVGLLRPFSTKENSVLQAAFAEWESFPPCDPSKKKPKVRMSYNVDIFLSVSQKLDGDHQSWLDDVNSIIDTFRNRRNSNVWTLCFENLNVIEIDIDPELDIYKPAESRTNRNWVHGPNTQFIKSIAAISSGEHGDYDTVFLMEGDVKPRKKFWLDSLMDEANDSNFAILGRYV